MKDKLDVGIIGAGRIGKIHTENIIRYIPDVNVKAVADYYPDQVKDWAEATGIKKLVKEPEEIIDDPDIDAVFICSPTNTHAEYTVKASKAGKDIFCEKPIDLDLDTVKATIKEVEKHSVKFQAGFNRRFDHNFRRVHDMIEDGSIGEINLLKITSWDPEPPPIEYSLACGGIFLDMTIHDFDMARFLSGTEVEEVYAIAAVRIDPDIGKVCKDYDTAIISLKFENGTIGVIDNCRQAMHGYDQRVEVLGSKGTAAILNDTPTTAVLSNDKGVCYEKPLNFFIERYADAYVNEIKEFFSAINEDRPPSVGLIDGLKPLEIGLAALKSAQEGRPVKIKEVT
jgi:myo-inositol 2-dehydrogenase/D-chiro-inositol 1-dehydrogenase